MDGVIISHFGNGFNIVDTYLGTLRLRQYVYVVSPEQMVIMNWLDSYSFS